MSIYEFDSLNLEKNVIDDEKNPLVFFFTREPRYFIYILRERSDNELIEVSNTTYNNVKELIPTNDFNEIFCFDVDEIHHILEFINIKSFSDTMTIAESLELM